MGKTLSFEEPIVRLREKIDELEEFTIESEVDLSDEIETLKVRLKNLRRRYLWKYGALGSGSSR